MESLAKFIWINGKFIRWKNAQTHLLTHVIHYGGGVFEGIRFYKTDKGPAVFRLPEHVKRLFYSAKVLRMKLPYTEKEFQEVIVKTVQKNKLKDGYIRPIVFYGEGTIGIYPKNNPIIAAVIAIPFGTYLGENPVKVKISSLRRIHKTATDMKAKICGNYVNGIVGTYEAREQGFEEALFLDHDGFVAEGTGENIFIVKNGTLFTPTDENILPGITRNAVFQLAKFLGIKYREKKIKPRELLSADEAFFSGTAIEIHPIYQINDTKLKHKFGPITKKIKETFVAASRGKIPQFKNWLTYCS